MTTQDIIGFVEGWRESNQITNEVLTESQQIKLMTEIQSKVSELSFESPIDGGKLILYNGTMGDVPAWQIAKGISEGSNGNYYYISSAEGGGVLNSKLGDVLVDTVGSKTIASQLMNGSGEYITIDGKAEWVRTSKYGVGDVLSMNDFVSTKLVANAKGDLMIFNSSFMPNGVCAQSEVAAAMANPDITSINGIPKNELFEFQKFDLNDIKMSESDSIQAVYELVSVKSVKDAAYIEVATTEKIIDGKPSIVLESIDMSKLEGMYKNFPAESASAGRSLLDVTTSIDPTVYENLESLKAKNSTLYKNTITAIKELNLITGENGKLGLKNKVPTLSACLDGGKYLSAKGTSIKALGAIGTVALAVDFYNMVGEAGEAYEKGDYDNCGKITSTWFASLAGVVLELGASILGFAIGSCLAEKFWDGVYDFFGLATQARRPIDPLILDLDGDCYGQAFL